jgi:hypothetical protein
MTGNMLFHLLAPSLNIVFNNGVFLYLMKRLVSIIALISLFAGCAKYMDEHPPNETTDSLAMRDSVLRAVHDNLPGVWIRKILTKPGEEGFTLKKDGSVNLINYYTMHGNRWEISNDTLRVFTYSDKDTVPRPRYYKVIAISDETMQLAPFGSPAGYVEEYHKRRINLAPSVTSLYHQEFIGKLQPMQVLNHDFTVKTMFDGEIKLICIDSSVRFTIMKNGVKIQELPTRDYFATFPPGEYTLRVVYRDEHADKTKRAEYNLVVAETETPR